MLGYHWMFRPGGYVTLIRVILLPPLRHDSISFDDGMTGTPQEDSLFLKIITPKVPNLTRIRD